MKRIKLKEIIAILIVLFCAGYIFKNVFIHLLTNYYLKKGGVHVRAVIIDKKNFIGTHNVGDEFTYSYRFSVNGDAFENNSNDEKLKVGDSIEVEYVKDWPSLNRPIKQADK
ncbi:MAG TPA: hypothetical protein VHB48_00525 [Chitinophagaceae bacterium]|nr:hypothetical protein [Chitinophagaceae bacterium]